MIDLHTHSTCSDGSDSPERIVELAAAAGLSAVALTDHDNMAGIAPARAAAEKAGIGFVAGCEVSCAVSSGTMHLLCYYAEEGDNQLSTTLERLRGERAARNDTLIELLRHLGIDISMDEVRAEAGSDTVGRPHFAAVLVGKGVVSSIQEAFDALLKKGAPAYVPKASLTGEEVVDVAARSGAVTVLAHPNSLGLEPSELLTEVARLTEAGLAGLECFYGRYEPSTRDELAALANRLGLVATGGSDYHGRFKPDLSIGTGRGDLEVPDSALDALAARRPTRGLKP